MGDRNRNIVHREFTSIPEPRPMQPGPGVVTKGKDLVSRGWHATATVRSEFKAGSFEVTSEAGAVDAMREALRGAIDQAEVRADNDLVAATVVLTRPRKVAR